MLARIDHGRLKRVLDQATTKGRASNNQGNGASRDIFSSLSSFLSSSTTSSPDSLLALLDGDSVSLVVSALARVSFDPDTEDSKLREHIVHTLLAMADGAERLSAVNVTTALWACAKLGAGATNTDVKCASALAVNAVAVRATRSAHNMDARGIATALHAFAAYANAAPPVDLLKLIYTRAERVFAHSPAPYDAATTLWAKAKLRQRHGLRPDCAVYTLAWTALASAAKRGVPPRDFAMAMQALGMLATSCDAPTFDELARSVRQHVRSTLSSAATSARSFSPQELAHVLWGAARHDEASDAESALSYALKPFADAAVESVHGAELTTESAHAASTSAWACARLGMMEGAVKASEVALSLTDYMNASDVGELAWAIGCVASNGRGDDVALPTAIWERAGVLAKEQSLTWQCCGLLEFASHAVGSAKHKHKRHLRQLAEFSAASTARASELAEKDSQSSAREWLESSRGAPWKRRRGIWKDCGSDRPPRVLIADTSPSAAKILADSVRSSGAHAVVFDRYASSVLTDVKRYFDDKESTPFDAVLLRLPRGRGRASSLMAQAAANALAVTPNGAMNSHQNKRKRADEDSSSYPTVRVFASPDTEFTMRTAFSANNGFHASEAPLGDWRVCRDGNGMSSPCSLRELLVPQQVSGGISLPQPDNGGVVASVTWYTVPDAGLFAGGAVDPMTRAFITHIPLSEISVRRRKYWHSKGKSKRHMRIADVACGSGVIACAIAHATPKARIYAGDFDRAAISAAEYNLAGKASVVHADVLAGFFGDKRFDVLVSNPPVHIGAHDSFGVLNSLLSDAPFRLYHGGELWLVAQSYVPVGCLAASCNGAKSKSKWRKIRLTWSDGQFSVWRLVRR